MTDPKPDLWDRLYDAIGDVLEGDNDAPTDDIVNAVQPVVLESIAEHLRRLTASRTLRPVQEYLQADAAELDAEAARMRAELDPR